jgi:hypothetical protein
VLLKIQHPPHYTTVYFFGFLSQELNHDAGSLAQQNPEKGREEEHPRKPIRKRNKVERWQLETKP